MAPNNPLSAPSLAKFMASSLPSDASPQIKSSYDTIALAVHAGMLAVAFKLKGLGEDHRIESDTAILPSEWNATSASYTFRYSHPQSSMEYIIKVGKLGSKATVDGIALGDEKRASFDFTVDDFLSVDNISREKLPATPVQGSVTDSSVQNILSLFKSPDRLSELGDLLKVQIIQKLAPGIHKEGYEESTTTASTSSRQTQREEPFSREPGRPAYDPLRYEPPPARPHPFADTGLGPRRPYPDGLEPPGFEDEHDILRGPRGSLPTGRNPLNIGHDDLYPPGLGPNDPLRPSFGPGGIGRTGGGGGMHPTFDDPLFGGRGGDGIRGDHQAPDGARYDPVFPGDPRGGPGRFPGAGHRGPGGAPHNPFGGFGSGDFI